jgi:hypothetical protein
MKTNSNTAFPTSPTRWKDGEYVVYINHKDNGIQPEGDEGKRHEAEFTISTGIDDASIATAFERHFADPEHDQKVIDTIEVEGKPAIEIVKTYPENLPKIKSAGILLDKSFIKASDEIKVLSGDADTNIRKLAGNIKNYVADLRDGKRTSATDKEVEQLIADNNVLITVQ